MNRVSSTLCRAVLLGLVAFICGIPSLARADFINDTDLPSLSDTAVPDLYSGAMGFQVPITVPPGVNGLQPALTLLYRSTNGNGWLGPGWVLEVGAIERSTRYGYANYTTDNYVYRRPGSTSELISVAALEYRSKIETDFTTINQVKVIGGYPEKYFVATNKSGVRYYFGQTENACIIGPQGVFRWALSSIQDTNGNTITFTYQGDAANQKYLHQISYNGNTITFTLEDRSSPQDTVVNNAAGFTITTDKRLKQIDMNTADGNLAGRYVLDYWTSTYVPGKGRLSFVQKFGKDGATVDISQLYSFTYLNWPNIGDVINAITNGFGSTVHISYTQPTSAAYTSTPPAPIPLTVDTITADSGNGNVSSTSYSFEGGFYYPAEYDFRGFNHATVTAPAGPDGVRIITETWFHQGNDIDIVPENATAPELATRANIATGYMKGKPYRVRVSDSSGYTHSETETIYTADKNGAAPWFTPPSQVYSYVCSGLNITGACKNQYGAIHSGTEYLFDSDYPTVAEYGNLSQEIHYGDLNASSDDFSIIRTYLPNTATGIVGLLTSETVYQGLGAGSTLVSSATYYYDGVTDCTSASTNQTPTRGLLTRIVRSLKYPGASDTTVEERMAYDSRGNLVCRRDGRGYITTIGYDATSTFPVTVTSPATINAPSGLTTTTSYYGVDGVPADKGLYGQVKSTTDPNNATTTMEYDALGRQTKRTLLSDNSWTNWYYNNFGIVGAQHVRVETSAGPWSSSYFDGFRRTFKVKSSGPDSKTIVSETEYDNRGGVSRRSLPYFEGIELPVFTSFVYDPLGRVTRVTAPLSATDNAITRSCYAPNVTVTIDPNNHRRREVRDAFGRLTTVQEYKGEFTSCTADVGAPYATTTYAYDVTGNLRFVSDTRQNHTEMLYDTLGRKRWMSDPDMGEWTYQYDENGNLTSQTDAKQQTIAFTYDGLNRVTGKYHGATLVLTNNYDEAASSNGKGRLTSTSGAGATVYNYDAMGRVSTSTKTIDGTAYSFGFGYLNGRLDSILYPDNETVSYGYNADGSLHNVGSYVTYSNYDALGRPGVMTYGSGVISQAAYDPVSKRLSGISVAMPSQAHLINNTYGYDTKGNITSITDNLNKPLPAVNLANETYTPARAHALGSTGSGRTFQYDANGNITSDGIRAITYNYDNMPTAMGNAGFTYDGNGTRIKKTAPGVSTVYIDKLYECTNGSCVKHIFAGNSRIALKSGGVVLYYHPDHQGSTSVITDAGGYNWEEIAYLPFGKTRQDTGSLVNVKYKYTGQELDSETGLYNYNARIYDPDLGRFLTPDTIVPDPANPQSLNRYSYVQNNPLNYVDPSGRFLLESLAVAAIIGAVVGTVHSGIMSNWDADAMLQGAAIGAASGVVFSAVSPFFTGAIACSLAESLSVNTAITIGEISGAAFGGAAAGATASAMSGGDAGEGAGFGALGGAAFAGMRVGFNYMSASTDASSSEQWGTLKDTELAARSKAGLPVGPELDTSGNQLTAGVRVGHSDSLLDFLKMNQEGQNIKFMGMNFDKNGVIGRAFTMVSKVHDFTNWFGYQHGAYRGYGTFLDTAFDVWSISGMPPAAAYTALAVGGPYMQGGVSYAISARRRR